MVKRKYTEEEIKKLIAENKKLHRENVSMQKILQSRRFHFAESVANVFNALFPVGSLRRKFLTKLVIPLRLMRRRKALRVVRKVEKTIKKHKMVIIMHSIPWNTPLRQRPHHLAKCLAELGAMVIYLEPDEPLRKIRIISENFVTINSWDVLFQLKMNKSKKYYFFFNNVSNIPFSLIKKIRDCGYELVYEYIDEFHEDISGSLVNQLETWEGLKKIKPRLVLASADKLFMEAKEHFGQKNVMLSKNAVVLDDFDYRNFSEEKTPEDLEKIIGNKHPVVGYYGALAPWLDYKLISEVASSNPDLNFVLIGVNYQNALKLLDQTIENIYYLGPKKYIELPKYSSKFDCAIIPFQLGEIAKGTSPVKLFEYMAMGLPTVGTRDLKECSGFEYVYLAKNATDFSSKIRLAIKEHKNETTKKILLRQADENTWMKRAGDIVERLKK